MPLSKQYPSVLSPLHPSPAHLSVPAHLIPPYLRRLHSPPAPPTPPCPQPPHLNLPRPAPHAPHAPHTLPPLRASPPMKPTVQPNGHVCTTCGAVTGSPNAEPKLSRSRLKLGLVSTSLAVGLFCGTPVFSQTYCTQFLRLPDRLATVCKPRVTISIGFRGPNRKPEVGQTTRGVSKQACLEWRCRSSSKRRAIPPGNHEMY